ncbi:MULTISPECIES: leucyl aminopeptidase [unclassified Haematobacter]|uniref:leucyl aminopeptidase n=1 Tax=unclassified Haematobacter TaxID=2640585 RepID=UPI0025C2C45E|nr:MULTISPECIES: leucyl aminopeptidase [unclassified Haematobacter]
MTSPVAIHFREMSSEGLAAFEGRIAVLIDPSGKPDATVRPLNRLVKGAIERFASSEAFEKMKPGDAVDLAWPAGIGAEAVQVVKLPRKPEAAIARKAGAAIGRAVGPKGAIVLVGGNGGAAELSFGLALRAYDFGLYKSEPPAERGTVTLMVADPEKVAAAAQPMAALAEGVFFTRDLVNEPANVLTTTDFAARLAAMQELGLDVEILEEADLADLGMRALLGVGQGSESPSKVVVMHWRGGEVGTPPLALVGKGVVFDTGGISLKPGAGMEEMTMDMGGAGVVAGVMRTLALRKARANVVGVVGLVENMPDGKAQRPGDVVKSKRGVTIEVNNTDAEGRLVLADVLWYAQERFQPSGIVDLATLTGAVIVALGHEMTGVFSNDDAFCDAFLAAAKAEGEGAWRLPLGDGYDRLIRSNIADIKNSAGREAGSVTAAQFLQRFIADGTPWIHLDIAGTAHVKRDTTVGPKGATGWGVMSLDRLIRDRYES